MGPGSACGLGLLGRTGPATGPGLGLGLAQGSPGTEPTLSSQAHCGGQSFQPALYSPIVQTIVIDDRLQDIITFPSLSHNFCCPFF